MKTKKSLLIAPALGVLLLAAAGSVSGTVAWFSAVRVFSTQVNEFSVVETEGNLNVTMVPVAEAGTVAGSENNSVKVKDASQPVVLTHGSYDHTTGKAYTLDPEDGTTHLYRGKVDGADDDAIKFLYQDDVKIKDASDADVVADVYIAVAWKMTFTYNFGSSTAPVGVYLDLKKSEFVVPDTITNDFRKGYVGANNANLDTAKGFRVAFVSTGDSFVWGNNTPIESAPDAWDKDHSGGYAAEDRVLKDGVIYEANAVIAEGAAWDSSKWNATGEITLNKTKTCDAAYVNGTAANATVKYTANNYVVHDADYERLENGVENVATALDSRAPEHICDLTTANQTVTVTCAAWYEGTDPNVVSGSAMKCLGAKMTVYARPLAVNP